eukprot:TRINITY_DN657_c1_g1_i1.p1 TRINITY_DN657_c1_g1~~TRINITY_DN657_c1_g1_i1.p1  ORF type:complete len:280 (-),score=83.18 TRINITY_DN657_c1_g1_i1:23-862(-)
MTDEEEGRVAMESTMITNEGSDADNSHTTTTTTDDALMKGTTTITTTNDNTTTTTATTTATTTTTTTTTKATEAAIGDDCDVVVEDGRKKRCRNCTSVSDEPFDVEDVKALVHNGGVPHKDYVTKSYTIGYLLDEAKGEDLYIHKHLNELILVGLAPSHPAMANTITKVTFDSNDRDLLAMKLTGTSNKKGALKTRPITPVCQVICEDGSAYVVCASVAGVLVEINKRAHANPGLVTHKSRTEGYLFIIQPTRHGLNTVQEALVSTEVYEERQNSKRLE